MIVHAQPPAANAGTGSQSGPPDAIAVLSAKVDQLLRVARRADARFLSVAGAASYASLSEESIRKLLAAGKLTPLRPVRGRVVIDRHELDAFVLSCDQRLRRGRGIR